MERDQARVELQSVTLERDREATAARQADADRGRLIGECDATLQVALATGDDDLIHDTIRATGSRSWRSARSVQQPATQPSTQQRGTQGLPSQLAGSLGAGPSQPPLFHPPGHGPNSPSEGESCG
ncbi:hypothetical protein KI387_044077 [Taxus chinensis]|uniref:Uncharacterized protein n=1 Tax=Taxus chinensis TaxID=29808 RepID=A0AA38L3Q3_TAXCH|nr:hypothetical protein KI387_044077 [Taxus chinensis]